MNNYCTDTQLNGLDRMKVRLLYQGGLSQQDRMIQDKRATLENAIFYSYQSALIKKIPTECLYKCLMNPNKLKPDYDEKVLSIGFENNIKPGDIFEWCNTKTYWLVYLQDLTELAYFRGEVRRCAYKISWKIANKNFTTYAAVRGPVETRLNNISKHSIIIDNPNYSLKILIPKNKDTLEYFQRYSKFYLNGDNTCWRVEAVDTISTPGIIEISAFEYYSNEQQDDISNGIAGGLIVETSDPNPEEIKEIIIGDTFIKPKKTYKYFLGEDYQNIPGEWYISNNKLPVDIQTNEDNSISIKWISSFSGQFDLWYGDKDGPVKDYKKTIIVETLF